MRNSGKLGKISLGCEVTTVTPFGVWVIAQGKEYFLGHKSYPWFREESVADVLKVISPRPDHLRWPALDIDLHIDSLENPERYPLIAEHNEKVVRKRKRKRAAH